MLASLLLVIVALSAGVPLQALTEWVPWQ